MAARGCPVLIKKRGKEEGHTYTHMGKGKLKKKKKGVGWGGEGQSKRGKEEVG